MADNEQFEWVNAWAAGAKAPTAPPVPQEGARQPATPPDRQPDQLARDLADIERARDAIAALSAKTFSAERGRQALTLVPSRTSDAVPVVIGGVLALVMLTVFGAAAAMTKLSR